MATSACMGEFSRTGRLRRCRQAATVAERRTAPAARGQAPAAEASAIGACPSARIRNRAEDLQIRDLHHRERAIAPRLQRAWGTAVVKKRPRIRWGGNHDDRDAGKNHLSDHGNAPPDCTTTAVSSTTKVVFSAGEPWPIQRPASSGTSAPPQDLGGKPSRHPRSWPERGRRGTTRSRRRRRKLNVSYEPVPVRDAPRTIPRAPRWHPGTGIVARCGIRLRSTP